MNSDLRGFEETDYRYVIETFITNLLREPFGIKLCNN